MAADHAAPSRHEQPADPGPSRHDAHGDRRDETTTPVVELLVHGVGGATPQQMLGDARTVRVTGDDTASVHRRTDDAEDRPWQGAEPVREAYSWSNLTSGNGARALWLLLLPFMIANVAHWMRPAVRGHARTHRVYDVLVRLVALSLTVLLISSACVIALDLFAWQCAASQTCADQRSWSGFLADGGWWSQPGRRVALAAALPAVLTLLLWWLSHRTWSAYESAYPPVRDRADGGEGAVLSLPGFWYGRQLVSRLRAAHAAAGLLTVCAAVQSVTWQQDRGPDSDSWLAAVGWALAALLAVGAAGVLVLVTRPGRSERETADPPLGSLVRTLPGCALVLLLLTVVHAGWDRPGWEAGGAHAGSGLFVVLTVVQGALIAGLAVAARRLHRLAKDTDRAALRGLGGPAMAMLACTLGGVLTSGSGQLVADWLEPPDGVGLPGPPVLLSWQATVIPSLLGVAGLLALCAVLRTRQVRRALAPSVPAAYPGEDTTGHPERANQIAGAVARARLTDAAPLLVGVLTLSSLLLGLLAVVGSQHTGQTPVDATDTLWWPVAGFFSVSQSVGSWLMSIGVLTLVAMGRRAYRDAAARRTVGILWDVGTFWPRAAHPFAPPCYAERAVPDLSWRMGTWIDATGGRLIISGHSQGSVLAAAAVWQLDAPTRSRVALLTHGSPLARLYGPWFPKYFGPDALARLRQDMPCWRNLWRETDPIGGPVGVGGDGQTPVDREPLRDPGHYGRNLVAPLPEPLLGHGDYAADPAYAEERRGLCEALRGARPLPPPAPPAHGS